jgi:hypothetical protein
VSNGNIKSYEIINQDQLPDGRWGVTIKSVVSVDKLTSFVQAKGIAVEIKGGLFALNVKQQLLNEQGEVKAVSEMIGLLHELMQTAFDYTIKTSDPKSLDAESKNWEIPIEVTATCNSNIDFCANYFLKTLAAISLNKSDVETYKSLNKPIFAIIVNHAAGGNTFFLRKEISMKFINSILSNWEFYTRLFLVQSGKEETYGNGLCNLYEFIEHSLNSHKEIRITFPKSGNLAGTFTWTEKRTLNEIEQMNGYFVKPRGVVSRIKHGGYVVLEKNGHGLVAAICDLESYSWDEAKKACNQLEMNGHNDWYLPSNEDLKSIYRILYTQKIGNLDFGSYWSSTEYNSNDAWNLSFRFGYAARAKHAKLDVRAVRAY